jgi:hypothetical protein
MFGSNILDVAIALVFVYLILSVVASGVNELIARIFGLRSKNLESGLRNLLRDDGIVDEFYDHPLIRGLGRDWGAKRPSYIPAQTFARVLLDIVGEHAPAGQPSERTGFLLRANVPSALRRPLEVFLAEVGEDMTRLRANVEEWFDHTMDRVAGWYKRRTQIALAVIALVVCAAANADTFRIVNVASRDKTIREAVVAAAGVAATDSSVVSSKRIDDLVEQVGSLGIPLGWTAQSRAEDMPEGRGPWALRIVGILITAAAVSLGAPFWFDVLNKMVKLPPAKQRTRASDE